MNGNYYYSFLNISFFSAIGRLLPIDASRIIVISFLIIINRFREGSLARRSRTKIIILLLFDSRGRPRRAPMKRPGRAGDGRAEHAFASASTLAMHEFVHDPHGLRCAVQARCNSCLVSRGDAPVITWDAYPNFTVNAGCTKCRWNWWGCQGNKPNECLSDIEHKVRTSIKTLMVKADPGKYKSTKSIHFKDHLTKEDGTPSDEVAKRLPAALKSNGYTQHDIDEWSMDLARDR